MIKALCGFALFSLVLAEGYAGPHCNQLSQETLASIVPVLNDDGSQASGIVIGRNFVLTAAHVVEGDGPFFVKIGNLTETASLHSVDPTNDLAVLAVATHNLVPIPLSMDRLRADQPVWALGYPLGGDLKISLGYVEEFHQGAVQTSAEIDSGHSGGGLFSCEADKYVLAGMLRGYGAFRRNGVLVKVDNFSISVTSRTIKRFVLN